MARSSDKAAVAEQTIPAYEKLGEKLTELLKETTFEIEGTPKLTVRIPKKGYRQRPVMATLELFFDGLYVSTRGLLILCFTPVDAQEWTVAEIPVGDIDAYLPLFASEVRAHLMLDIESEATPDVLLAAIEQQLEEERKRAEAEELARKKAFSGNPIFGMF